MAEASVPPRKRKGRQLIDLVGQTFGRLTVLAQDGFTGRGQARWLCACACGRTATIPSHRLRDGTTKSCGCLRTEILILRSRTHGHSMSPTYQAWSSMIGRCENPNNNRFRSYGGRGITVCPQWRADFAAFLADMGEKPAGLSLDRIDVNGPYAPGNVRWATDLEQMNNMRTNVRVEVNGITMTLVEFSRSVGVRYGTLWWRMRHMGEPPTVAARALLAKRRGHSAATSSSAKPAPVENPSVASRSIEKA